MTTPGPVKRATPSNKNVPAQHITDLPESEVTVAEILKQSGYTTAHFGKWHLAGGGPGKHGFDKHDGETGNEDSRHTEPSNPKDIFGVTKRAQRFMVQSVRAKQPFYVQLSHYAVHSPVKTLTTSQQEFEKKKPSTNHTSAEFAGMTKDFDTSVGQIIQTIKALGISESTYLIFMSDNGAGLPGRRSANLPLTGSKGSLFEGGIRVPFIVTGPKVVKGKYCYENVVGYDLFPTICSLTGVTNIPQYLEGCDLSPLLKGGSDLVRQNDELIFHFLNYGHRPNQVPQSAIILDNMKMIVNDETGKVSMFNLNTDIGETKDLVKQFPDRAKVLYQRLKVYLQKVNAQYVTINHDYDSSAVRESGKKNNNGNSNKFMQRSDTNADGKVSKSEFKGPSRAFSKFDINNDGYISSNEAPTGPPSKR